MECEGTPERNKINIRRKTERKKSIYGSYSDLLRMYVAGIVPNDATIDEICGRHPRIITKTPDDCHTYYNCSGEDYELSKWIPKYYLWPTKYKHECHYPFVFSDKSLQCENYTEVDCGTRHLPTWECEYFRIKCKPTPCKPCYLDYPSCKNLTDGVWPLPENPYYPYYKRCENERTIEKGRCPADLIWRAQSFPYNGQCVQRYALPKEHHLYGYLPSCKDEQDGVYQYPVGYCSGHYLCSNGEASAVKCPNNTVFDTATKTCAVNGNCIT